MKDLNGQHEDALPLFYTSRAVAGALVFVPDLKGRFCQPRPKAWGSIVIVLATL